jgi:hypothetical protein
MAYIKRTETDADTENFVNFDAVTNVQVMTRSDGKMQATIMFIGGGYVTLIGPPASDLLKFLDAADSRLSKREYKEDIG